MRKRKFTDSNGQAHDRVGDAVVATMLAALDAGDANEEGSE